MNWAAVSACSALVVALGVAAKPIRRYVCRPAFWVFRHLIGDPVTEWARTTIGTLIEAHTGPIATGLTEVKGRVATIEAELRPNGGTSTKDTVDAIARAVGADGST